MADFGSAKTNSGVELPLMNLKGKAYMLVAHRILWLNEDVKRFTVETDFPVLNDEQAVARAHVRIYNDAGDLVKSSTATKRETKKDFPDFTEKAETGAIGRAVTLLGFGTAFALADLAEGERIIDAPLERKAISVRQETPKMEAVITTTELPKEPVVIQAAPEAPKKSSFRKPSATKPEASGGWK